MPDGRKRITSILATLCVAALGGTVLVAAPQAAGTDLGHAKQQAQQLYHQAEQASERFDAARVRVKKARVQLKALQADLHHQQDKVDAIRAQVAQAVVAHYQGQAFSSTTQLLLSKNPDAFLDQLSTVSQFNDQQTQMMAEFGVQAKQLAMRQQAAQRQLDQIRATKKKMADEKAVIDKKAAAAKALVGKLESEAAARQAAPSRSAQRQPLARAVPASGSASAAVNYAMAQIGKAYVYGAAGPNAFDCSGLTMMAWRQAGVSLPHSAAAQMGYGTPVSSSALQPGDLVFYYHPVSHVGIYIGNGNIVHAANPSTGVQITGVFTMPLTAARRIG
ncbi:MAG TPA: NlpC/P60 family protein [Nocardioidaceae bacterium]|nr:NlpC/P60 family protein [Nocardioidaceae bacterium]